MPDLLDRLQEFARRNLPDPPAAVQEAARAVTEPVRQKPATPVALPLPTERDRFVANMLAMVGGKYCSPPNPRLYKRPRCTDCSGAVAWAYYQATGRRIAGDGSSYHQMGSAGRKLKRGKNPEPWLPGDLLFYLGGGHVGVYVGDGMAVHAMNERQGIIKTATNTQYWNSNFVMARRLWEAPKPAPDPDPDPDPQPEPQPGAKPVTAAAAPILPALSAPITFATPMRQIAAIGVERWAEILTDAASPMAAEAAAIWAACGPLVTVAGAQSYKESQYGKAAAASYNPLGLMEPDGRTLMRFANWTAAFTEWWERITDSAYKGGVYMPRDLTLEQFIVIYVGGPRCLSTGGAECGNGETWKPGGGPSAGSINLYLYQTKARINRYLGTYDADPLWPDFDGGNPEVPTPTPTGYTAHRIEGSAERLYLPSDIAFKVQLTPAWRTCNRSGRAMRPTGIRQHETGNTRPGTGAQMHADWQYNGTQGHPDGCVAVHFYTDDGMVIQTLPVNEQGIHSGDAGNQTQIAIEKCVNSDIDRSKSYRIAVALEAGLQHMFGFDPDEHMWMHHENAGCPPGLRAVWGQFERDVQNALDAIKRSI